MSCFVRGFASVLSMHGDDDKDELVFGFRGRDLESESTEQALESDWLAFLGTTVDVPLSDTEADG